MTVLTGAAILILIVLGLKGFLGKPFEQWHIAVYGVCSLYMGCYNLWLHRWSGIIFASLACVAFMDLGVTIEMNKRQRKQ